VDKVLSNHDGSSFPTRSTEKIRKGRKNGKEPEEKKPQAKTIQERKKIPMKKKVGTDSKSRS